MSVSDRVHEPVEIAEDQALAAWRVLRHGDLDAAALATLEELLREVSPPLCAFLAVSQATGEVRYWGRTGDGTVVEDASLLANHEAVRDALAGEACFTKEARDGAAFGPELFLGGTAARETSVAASLRRPLGAAPYGEEEAEILKATFAAVLPALERAILRTGDTRPEPPAPDAQWTYYGLACRSPAMRRLVEDIERIKETDFSVLITGESGSGKELVARALHEAGARRDRPFVSESASAITESLVESELFGHVKGAFTGAEEDKDGLFVLAGGGTLYLDEIGDMSPAMQRKLLRVIQEGIVRPVGASRSIEVDVRLITSTNRNLDRLVEDGQFRADLYWRLNVITVEVPPLRSRREDLPLLVRAIQEGLRTEGLRVRPLSESALRAAENYHWPGNVRQLQSVLRRASMEAAGREIGKKELLRHLPRESATPWRGEGFVRDGAEVMIRVPLRPSFKGLVGECEKAILANALREHAWNKSEVTRALKIPRQSLYNKMEKYGLAPPEEG
jgi:DNA-binding NtrC family response regulator